MSSALYFVALAAQMLASLAVLITNAWMVNTLVNRGYTVEQGNVGFWVSFYGLMTIAFLSIVVPVVQGLCMGCLCCGGCIRRPLSKGHYTAQSIFLGLQAILWIAAAGYGITVLYVNDLITVFGNVQYLAIVCSWLAPVLAIVMIIVIIRLRAARVEADAGAHHTKNDA